MTSEQSNELKITRDYFLNEFGVDITIPWQRKLGAKHSFRFFCLYYLAHYFNLTPADFHYALWEILEDPDEEATAIIGFRGSAKSTFCSMAYPLWCAMFKKYHFILLINDTTAQMRINILNIKTELEQNDLIAMDFPGIRSTNKWTQEQLVLSTDVFIMGRSRGQKIRGLRYKQYRPDLIIGDDLEDLEWVRKKDNRDKTFRWFKSEVVPAQEELKAKMMIIGNLLHRDALMYRLKAWKRYKILEYPLIDADGYVTWPSKYPTTEAVDKQQEKIADRAIWSREYLLKVISEEDQIIKDENIHKYPVAWLDDKETMKDEGIRIVGAATALDLAISEKETADFTAGVTGYKVTRGGKTHILIRKDIIHRRMSFHDTASAIEGTYKTLPLGGHVVVEDVGYQRSALQELRKRGMSVKGIRPISDKRARLEAVAHYIIDGTVLFPDFTSEELNTLINEMLGFGVEEHDDLLDALVYLIMDLMQSTNNKAVISNINKV